MRKFLKFLGIVFVIFLVGILLLMIMAFTIPGGIFLGVQIASNLLLGWISFVKRVAPEIESNGNLIGMALACGGLILAISHGFLAWIAETSGRRKWCFKWTFCLNGILFLCFFVGMSFAGTVHQIGWMKGSEETWNVVKRGRDFPSMISMRIENIVYDILSEFPDKNIRELRTEIRIDPYFHGEKLDIVQNKYHVFLLADPQGNYRGTIVWPRTESQGIPFRILIDLDLHAKDSIIERLNINELEDVLNRYGKNMVSL